MTTLNGGINLDKDIPMFELRLRLLNKEALPASIKLRQPRGQNTIARKKTKSGGTMIVESTTPCDLSTILYDLAKQSYELVGASYQIQGERGAIGKVASFIFVRHDLVADSNKLREVRKEILLWLQDVYGKNLWGVTKVFKNPYRKDGCEVPGNFFLSVYSSACQPLFDEDQPVMRKQKNELGHRVGALVPLIQLPHSCLCVEKGDLRLLQGAA